MQIKMKMLVQKALLFSVATGFAVAASLPTPAGAFPGAQQGQQGQAQAQPQAQAAVSGKVVETMDSGGYTYVCLENGGKKTWAAVPKTEVKVGQQVSLAPGMAMQNFTSKTLNRTFDSIYFCGGLTPVPAK